MTEPLNSSIHQILTHPNRNIRTECQRKAFDAVAYREKAHRLAKKSFEHNHQKEPTHPYYSAIMAAHYGDLSREATSLARRKEAQVFEIASEFMDDVCDALICADATHQKGPRNDR